MSELKTATVLDFYDTIVVGGGPAGMAAALSARQNGAKTVLLIERDKEIGGILNQCIHNGFGLHYFKKEMTGPEYAEAFADQIKTTDITVLTDTMVLEVTADKTVTAVSAQYGYMELKAGAICLCMGCRERTRGAIAIPGDRPSGVFTAGTAQRYVNLEGKMVGRRVVILGSGDIGLIMARRMTLEGAKVLACVELCPYSNGLNRNIVQCLEDYDIPLYLSHTITRINGRQRVESVEISRVGDDRRTVEGSEFTLECDTVLLSVGLIPENELTRKAGIAIDPHTNGPVVYENRMTSVPGVFAGGNVVHVHDLVDYVTEESTNAGAACGEYVSGVTYPDGDDITLNAGPGANYTVPQKIHRGTAKKSVDVFLRTNKPRGKSEILVTGDDGVICRYKRPYMTPGEMEKITIPTVLLRKLKAGQSLNVSVSDVEEQSAQSSDNV